MCLLLSINWWPSAASAKGKYLYTTGFTLPAAIAGQTFFSTSLTIWALFFALLLRKPAAVEKSQIDIKYTETQPEMMSMSFIQRKTPMSLDFKGSSLKDVSEGVFNSLTKGGENLLCFNFIEVEAVCISQNGKAEKEVREY